MKDILKMVGLYLGLCLFTYYVWALAMYSYNPDPYGYWHFLTRSTGWINDDLPMSSSLHWIFPYDKKKEHDYYMKHFAKDQQEHHFTIIVDSSGKLYRCE